MLKTRNKIGGNIYLTLDGPRDYNFWVEPGKSVQELVPGNYKYSYYAEGGYEKGMLNLKQSGGTFVMKIDKGKLKIKSKYPQNIFVSFSGPIPYYLWVIPGRSTLEMRVGNYEYQYWADGKRYGGSINIPKRAIL